MKPTSTTDEEEDDDKWALAQPLELGAVEVAAMASLCLFSLRRVKPTSQESFFLIGLVLASERERERIE
jgi:hypothetical protein